MFYLREHAILLVGRVGSDKLPDYSRICRDFTFWYFGHVLKALAGLDPYLCFQLGFFFEYFLNTYLHKLFKETVQPRVLPLPLKLTYLSLKYFLHSKLFNLRLSPFEDIGSPVELLFQYRIPEVSPPKILIVLKLIRWTYFTDGNVKVQVQLFTPKEPAHNKHRVGEQEVLVVCNLGVNGSKLCAPPDGRIKRWGRLEPDIVPVGALKCLEVVGHVFILILNLTLKDTETLPDQ